MRLAGGAASFHAVGAAGRQAHGRGFHQRSGQGKGVGCPRCAGLFEPDGSHAAQVRRDESPRRTRSAPRSSRESKKASARWRERLQLAQGDDITDAQIYVSSAEAELRLAEDTLAKAQAANRRLAGTISQGEVDRLIAQRDLAKVRIDKAKHLASESPLSNVRFELEQLREEVQELRLLVALLRFRN